MRVLVTGGGGFIGSHLVESLVGRGAEVVVVDREPRYRPEGAEMVVADLNHPQVAADIVKGVDQVFHLAAKVGLGVDFADSPDYVADNDLATARLLAALAGRNFGGRLVLSSSMVVYGEGLYRCPTHGQVTPPPRESSDLDRGRFEPGCPVCGDDVQWKLVTEDEGLAPRSVYAATKVAQEHLCALWAAQTGASVVALRYHNVYGPRLPLDTPYAGVAAIFRSSLAAGVAPRVFEDGGQTRDFVHTSDVVEATVRAAEVEPAEGHFEAVNVCSGRPVTIGAVAGALADVFGPKAPRPLITGQWRHGDVRHVVASQDKARRILGLEDTVDIRTGLADLVALTR